MDEDESMDEDGSMDEDVGEDLGEEEGKEETRERRKRREQGERREEEKIKEENSEASEEEGNPFENPVFFAAEMGLRNKRIEDVFDDFWKALESGEISEANIMYGIPLLELITLPDIDVEAEKEKEYEEMVIDDVHHRLAFFFFMLDPFYKISWKKNTKELLDDYEERFDTLVSQATQLMLKNLPPEDQILEDLKSLQALPPLSPLPVPISQRYSSLLWFLPVRRPEALLNQFIKLLTFAYEILIAAEKELEINK
eukprot:TRINITY_DN1550_c2_g1_i3.p1 TRINITY_DN1550_c2_g1~~TRINITY_DN1550_c2_g1_i3.p1  ORF type:complete len:275 (-),score=85.14 TRINITY_DN1550_c2_g1_i3:26-790(-)